MLQMFSRHCSSACLSAEQSGTEFASASYPLVLKTQRKETTLYRSRGQAIGVLLSRILSCEALDDVRQRVTLTSEFSNVAHWLVRLSGLLQKANFNRPKSLFFLLHLNCIGHVLLWVYLGAVSPRVFLLLLSSSPLSCALEHTFRALEWMQRRAFLLVDCATYRRLLHI